MAGQTQATPQSHPEKIPIAWHVFEQPHRLPVLAID